MSRIIREQNPAALAHRHQPPPGERNIIEQPKRSGRCDHRRLRQLNGQISGKSAARSQGSPSRQQPQHMPALQRVL
jgi:hypothetical protein